MSTDNILSESAVPRAARRAANPNPWTTQVPPLKRNSEGYGKPNSGAGHRFEKHQYARAFYEIKKDGRVHLWSKFTNNKRWDGDHFAAVWVARDAAGKVIFWSKHGAGLDGENLGGPGDRYVHTKGRIKPEQVEAIKTITVRWAQPNARDDVAFWRAVQAIVCALIDCNGEGEEESTEIK